MEIESGSNLCLLNFCGGGDECGFLYHFCLNIRLVEHHRFQLLVQARILRMGLQFPLQVLDNALQIQCLLA